MAPAHAQRSLGKEWTCGLLRKVVRELRRAKCLGASGSNSTVLCNSSIRWRALRARRALLRKKRPKQLNQHSFKRFSSLVVLRVHQVSQNCHQTKQSCPASLGWTFPDPYLHAPFFSASKMTFGPWPSFIRASKPSGVETEGSRFLTRAAGTTSARRLSVASPKSCCAGV